MNEQMYKRIVLIAAIVAVASIGIAGTILGTRGVFSGKAGLSDSGRRGTINVDEEKTYPVDRLESLDIFSTSAEIEFIEDESSTVRVHLHGTVRAANTKNIPTLVERQSGKNLEVGSERPKRGIGLFSSDLRVSVYLPSTFSGDIKADSVSGDIMLPFGDYTSVSADTTSGDIYLNGVEGDTIDLNTTSGDVSARNITSEEFIFDTTSGDLTASGSPGEVKADSTSGTVRIDYNDFSESADIDVTSGDVTISLPGGSSFDLTAKSTSGDIRCGFPITMDGSSGSDRKNLEGTVGSGGPDITIRTVSGDIRVDR